MSHLKRLGWGLLMLLGLLSAAGLMVGTILGVAHHPKIGMPLFLLAVAYLLGTIKNKTEDGTIK